MLKAYYPVLYLTSYEYDRTKQKIEGIVNILRSENKNVRLFNWNCVDGLRLIEGVTQFLVKIGMEKKLWSQKRLLNIFLMIENPVRIYLFWRTLTITLKKRM